MLSTLWAGLVSIVVDYAVYLLVDVLFVRKSIEASRFPSERLEIWRWMCIGLLAISFALWYLYHRPWFLWLLTLATYLVTIWDRLHHQYTRFIQAFQWQSPPGAGPGPSVSGLRQSGALPPQRLPNGPAQRLLDSFPRQTFDAGSRGRLGPPTSDEGRYFVMPRLSPITSSDHSDAPATTIGCERPTRDDAAGAGVGAGMRRERHSAASIAAFQRSEQLRAVLMAPPQPQAQERRGESSRSPPLPQQRKLPQASLEPVVRGPTTPDSIRTRWPAGEDPTDYSPHSLRRRPLHSSSSSSASYSPPSPFPPTIRYYSSSGYASSPATERSFPPLSRSPPPDYSPDPAGAPLSSSSSRTFGGTSWRSRGFKTSTPVESFHRSMAQIHRYQHSSLDS